MRFFLRAIALSLKRRLRRAGTISLTALLVLLTGGVSFFLAGEGQAVQIRAAVAFAQDDAFGARVADRLEAFGGPVLFERYDLSQRGFLEEAVAAGELECAYLLSPGLEERIARGRADGGIELLVSPSSVAHALANSMVHAAVLGEKAPGMTAELITEVLGEAPEQAAKIADERFEYYGGADIFLAPQFVYAGSEGGSEIAGISAGSRLLHGIIALLLMAGVIWAIPQMIEETPGLLRRMPGYKSRVYCFATAFALGISAFLSGAAALLAVRLIYPAALGTLSGELGWLAAYTLALGMAGAAVPLLLRRAHALYGGGIFMLLLTAALGGVIIDLAEIGPLPAAVSGIFPTAGYIGGALGGSLNQGIAIFALTGLGAAVILLGAGKSRR